MRDYYIMEGAIILAVLRAKRLLPNSSLGGWVTEEECQAFCKMLSKRNRCHFTMDTFDMDFCKCFQRDSENKIRPIVSEDELISHYSNFLPIPVIQMLYENEDLNRSFLIEAIKMQKNNLKSQLKMLELCLNDLKNESPDNGPSFPTRR